MDNKDYNEPRRDYCSPEEEVRYERPLYETAEEYNQARREQEQAQFQTGNEQYAYNQYESSYNNYNNYGNGSYYGNGGYTNMGGVILDSNGKPLKNRFGVQLTFSILEMLCCCFGCIPMILGIVACVLTCIANSCYKQGRYDEFKSKSKASSVLLIVGGAFAALTILTNTISVFANWDDFWTEFEYEFEKELEDELGYDIDMDTFWEDIENYEDDIYYDDDYEYDGDYEYDDDYEYDGNFKDFYNENADHVNFDDFNEIIVDGVTISLPCTYADLEAAGFFMNRTDLNTDMEAGSSNFYELHCDEKAYIADVQVINPGEESIKVQDGIIIYLDFYYESVAENEIFDGYEFVNGLDVFATVDETLSILGEADYGYVEDTDYGKRTCYEWYFEDQEGYLSYVTVTFYDDVLFDIAVNNGPEEY